MVIRQTLLYHAAGLTFKRQGNLLRPNPKGRRREAMMSVVWNKATLVFTLRQFDTSSPHQVYFSHSRGVAQPG